MRRSSARVGTGKFGVILAYHGVMRREPEATQVVPSISRERFRDHLRHLGRHYTVVPLPELIRTAASRRRGEPYPVALSFDDDLGEHLDNALPLLGAEGTPATFFLCGRDLLGDGEFWWETLQRAAESGASAERLGSLVATGGARAPAAPGLRETAAAIETMSEEARSSAVAELNALAGERAPERRLIAGGIAELVGNGHSIGFHTRRHPLLTSLGPDALRDALRDGRDELEAASRMPVETIAYPHGKVDARVADAARQQGFTLGLATGEAAVNPRSDPLRLERLAADELSAAEIGAAIAAMIGRAHSSR